MELSDQESHWKAAQKRREALSVLPGTNGSFPWTNGTFPFCQRTLCSLKSRSSFQEDENRGGPGVQDPTSKPSPTPHQWCHQFSVFLSLSCFISKMNTRETYQEGLAWEDIWHTGGPEAKVCFPFGDIAGHREGQETRTMAFWKNIEEYGSALHTMQIRPHVLRVVHYC